jgi:hypothetical protein
MPCTIQCWQHYNCEQQLKQKLQAQHGTMLASHSTPLQTAHWKRCRSMQSTASVGTAHKQLQIQSEGSPSSKYVVMQ